MLLVFVWEGFGPMCDFFFYFLTVVVAFYITGEFVWLTCDEEQKEVEKCVGNKLYFDRET